MLVVKRRERDQIVFPEVGISVVVTKLTRSRVSLGIIAPRSIRVVRHEVLAKSDVADHVSDGGEASMAVDGEPALQDCSSHLDDEIANAIERLKGAQEDLLAGRTDDALTTLGHTLAELDGLKAKTRRSNATDADPWSVAGGVAESAGTYRRSSGKTGDDVVSNVLYVNSAGHDCRAGKLAAAGFGVHVVADALHALYELSRRDPPDAVVLGTSETDPESRFAIRLIRNCSQHRYVPIMCANVDVPSIANQLRSIMLYPAMAG